MAISFCHCFTIYIALDITWNLKRILKPRKYVQDNYKCWIIGTSLDYSWSFGISSDLEKSPVQMLSVHPSRFFLKPFLENGWCIRPSLCTHLRMIQLTSTWLSTWFLFSHQIPQYKGHSRSCWTNMYMKPLQILWSQEK